MSANQKLKRKRVASKPAKPDSSSSAVDSHKRKKKKAETVERKELASDHDDDYDDDDDDDDDDASGSMLGKSLSFLTHLQVPPALLQARADDEDDDDDDDDYDDYDEPDSTRPTAITATTRFQPRVVVDTGEDPDEKGPGDLEDEAMGHELDIEIGLAPRPGKRKKTQSKSKKNNILDSILQPRVGAAQMEAMMRNKGVVPPHVHLAAAATAQQQKRSVRELLGPSTSDIRSMVNNTTARPRKKGRKKSEGSRPRLSAAVAQNLRDANDAYLRRDFRLGIQLLRGVIRDAPNHPEPYMTIGQMYEETEDYAKAVEAYTISAHLEPTTNEEDWRRLADLARDKGTMQSAIHCYSQVLRSSPKDLGALYFRAQLYSELGTEHKKVIDGVRTILARTSPHVTADMPELYVMLAKAHDALGHAEKAIGDLKQYMSDFKNKATSGNVLDALEPAAASAAAPASTSGAVASSSETKEDSKIDMHAVNMLMELLIETKNFEDGITVTKEVRNLSPEPLPAEIGFKHGICLLHCGDLAGAEGIFNSLLVRDDIAEYPVAVFDVAVAYMEMQYHERALSLFDSLSTVSDPDLDQRLLWLNQAHCLRHLGQNLQQLERSASLYERVLQSLVDNGSNDPKMEIELRFNLSDVYRRLGQVEDALLVMEPVAALSRRIVSTSNGRTVDVLDAESAPTALINPWISNPAELRLISQRAAVLYEAGHFDSFLQLCLGPILESIKAGTTDADRPDEILLEMPGKKKGAGRPRKTQEHYVNDVMRTVEFIDLLITVIKVLHAEERDEDAMDLVTKADRWLVTRSRMHKDKRSEEFKSNLQNYRRVAVDVCCIAENYDKAYDHIRRVVGEQPNNLIALRILDEVLRKLFFHVKVSRFVTRLMERRPDNPGLGVLVGHSHAARRKPNLALQNYLRVYLAEPNNPSVCLYIGTSYLAIASTAQRKNYTMLCAFAFLFKYYALRDGSPEAAYNLARAFHGIGLMHMAIPYYNKVLVSGHILSRHAAHNMAMICKKSGNVDMARRFYIDHVTIRGAQ